MVFGTSGGSAKPESEGGNLNKEAAAYYSPCEVVKVEKTIVAGMPDISRITTSHIEKQNLLCGCTAALSPA